jgi:hypothetical protein
MGFIAVTAWLDIRYDARTEAPIAEFSWEGVDEGDQPIGPRLGFARNRRAARRTLLLPHWRRFGLRVRALVGTPTAC